MNVSLGAVQAPPGYWTNPANPTQWLSQTDAAKVGNVCWQGLHPGRLTVGGNFQNSALYCGPFTSSASGDAWLFYGGAALVSLLFLPGGWKLLAVPLAGLAVLGQIQI